MILENKHAMYKRFFALCKHRGVLRRRCEARKNNVIMTHTMGVPWRVGLKECTGHKRLTLAVSEFTPGGIYLETKTKSGMAVHNVALLRMYEMSI